MKELNICFYILWLKPINVILILSGRMCGGICERRGRGRKRERKEEGEERERKEEEKGEGERGGQGIQTDR